MTQAFVPPAQTPEVQTAVQHLQPFLRGLGYPAGKQQIVEYAHSQGAHHDPQALALLQHLANRQYDSPVELHLNSVVFVVA